MSSDNHLPERSIRWQSRVLTDLVENQTCSESVSGTSGNKLLRISLNLASEQAPMETWSQAETPCSKTLVLKQISISHVGTLRINITYVIYENCGVILSCVC